MSEAFRLIETGGDPRIHLALVHTHPCTLILYFRLFLHYNLKRREGIVLTAMQQRGDNENEKRTLTYFIYFGGKILLFRTTLFVGLQRTSSFTSITLGTRVCPLSLSLHSGTMPSLTTFNSYKKATFWVDCNN